MAPALIQEVDEEEVPTSLELTPVESILRSLLLDVARHIDESPSRNDTETHVELSEELARAELVLRFTGGWVRDKLLGVPSHDIDVAINKMTGYQFGLRMKEYLEIPGNLAKYDLDSIAANESQSHKAGITDKSKTVGGLHKIEANPEKSKHLETATVRILGLDVDLVNLRKETYTDDSRNPQMEFGTPEEDALRRDATVNAMFYNINTREIEDFTGQGHEDMKKKLLRTPLEPFSTFKDDPLRVLRLIRFASRLGYALDPNASAAMRNPEIKDALRRKISRERVGTEIEKALQGEDPHEALRLVFEFDLYDTVFTDPNEESSAHFPPDCDGWETVIDTLNDISANGGTLAENLMRDSEERYLAWQLAAMVPYRNAPLLEPSEPGRRPPPPIAVTVAREGIKAPNKICDVISGAVRNQNEIATLVDRLHERKRRPEKRFEGDDPAARDILGMALRRWGASWRSQVIYSMLARVADDGAQVDTIVREYNAFVSHIQELEILDVITIKPLLDGKALAKALNTRPGPWMKDALDVVLAWQLRHPGINDPQAAIEEVKSHQATRSGELTSALTRHFLKLTIRPLFIKASPSSLTEQGRKSTNKPLPPKYTVDSMNDDANKPWKSAKETHVLELLKWVVEALDEKTLAEVWPMVVPPLLTLVDDWETRYKRMGARLLESLLLKVPPPLLERTGLGEVFEDALMPCLTYLPTLTEVDDSVALLSATYPALLALARVRYPRHPHVALELSAPALQRQRTKMLDTIVRKGILYGHAHCSHYPKIVTVLFDGLAPLLDDLGIDSVKHIKYLLPMLTETLSHPLATDSAPTTPMLSSALTALQALIRNCWPRMAAHRGDALKGIVLCWLQSGCAAAAAAVTAVDERDAGQDPTTIRPEDSVRLLATKLGETVQMLEAAVGEECDFAAEGATLVAADSRLRPLFSKTV